MNVSFLDTSFIIALEDADDQNHNNATLYWKGFKKRPCKLVTTSYIFDETVTLMEKMFIKEALAFDEHFRQIGFQTSNDIGN